MLHIDVILPLPLEGVYSYIVPDKLAQQVFRGVRVVVPFGKRKFYTGIVYQLNSSTSSPNQYGFEMKEILSVLDDKSVVLDSQICFWEWISTYYMSNLGDVCQAALPSALKLESETYISLTPKYDNLTHLSLKENEIVNFLQTVQQSLKISAIQQRFATYNIPSIVKSLTDKGIIQPTESLNVKVRPKTEQIISLFSDFTSDEVHIIATKLLKSPVKKRLFDTFLQMSLTQQQVAKDVLLRESGVSAFILNQLVKLNILKIEDVPIARSLGKYNPITVAKLNKYQQVAYSDIQNLFMDKNSVLLYGITSSGKTEIYMNLIKDYVDKGFQVLLLLPEIALTTQITERLQSVFQDRLLSYHSRFTDRERAEVWNTLLEDGKGRIILGPRSALFLPFTNLGLIIVDEEHEPSYKQQDTTPRYHGRDAAIMLAEIHKSKVLLGTATPSIETYYNALQGKYGLVRLVHRYEDIALPDIEVVNTKELRRKKLMKSVLSPYLIEQIQERLDMHEQIILFQNRRGFAPLIECQVCSWTPLCKHCDVSLTYHKIQKNMVCHYCGAIYDVPVTCPQCNADSLNSLGYGTERIAEEVSNAFPGYIVDRMDTDTTKAKKSYSQIITAFADGRTNILIGTQMLSKGLDFDNVSLVSILSADTMLNFPNFRAYERAFQLMLQVSGRAGRKKKQGKVILQTSRPTHPVIESVKNYDYDTFFNTQIDERKLFSYPPFSRLIEINLRFTDETLLIHAASELASNLRNIFGRQVLGPSRPTVSRIRNLYIRQILLKVEPQFTLNKVKDALKYYQQALNQDKNYKNIQIYYDVDPL